MGLCCEVHCFFEIKIAVLLQFSSVEELYHVPLMPVRRRLNYYYNLLYVVRVRSYLSAASYNKINIASIEIFSYNRQVCADELEGMKSPQIFDSANSDADANENLAAHRSIS